MILEGLFYIALFVLGIIGGFLLVAYLGLVVFLVTVVLLIGSVFCLIENGCIWIGSKLRRWYGR
jgi:hypothetical protein